MVDMIKVLAAKKEAVYATDSAPTLAANAILTRNFSAKPIEVDRVARNLDGRTWGATPDMPSNERQTISYEVEIAGSGAAGTAPAWMELLEGCGMAPAVLTASVKAEQRMAAPNAVAGSLSQYHWIGDQQRKMVGSRGTFSLDFTAGSYPFIKMDFTGLIPAATPFATAVPGASALARWKEPLEVSTANTSIMLDGYAALVRSLRVDAGVQTNVRNLVGSRYINRGQHAISGKMMIEAPALATKDYLATLRSGAQIALALTHGVGAGKIIELSCPQLQITDISESDEDAKLMWDIGFNAVIVAGQDDLIITAK